MTEEQLRRLLDRYFDGGLDGEAMENLENELLASRRARVIFWQHSRLEQALRSGGNKARGERLLVRMQQAEAKKKRWARGISAIAAVFAILASAAIWWPVSGHRTGLENDGTIAKTDFSQIPAVPDPNDPNGPQELSSFPAMEHPEVRSIGNELFQRQLSFDGKTWRTTQFTLGNTSIDVLSDEFSIRLIDDREWTVTDFQANGDPVVSREGNTTILTIRYKWPAKPPVGAPEHVVIRYTAKPGEAWTRKTVALTFSGEASVDRLEVERFSVSGKASRGGRGEPVFLDDRWFFGLEYPAGHSRHTDGNTPPADSHHFEMAGNYSFIDLAGRDKDTKSRPGLIRLFHFPGDAGKNGEDWKIVSKTSMAGGGGTLPATEQFANYLKTIQKPNRSFTHYNNWFDPAGKSLKGDNFLNIYRQLAAATKPYGVMIDAMVPDDGWQNRQSVWEPSPHDFPGGFPDLVKLSEALRKEGTSLGLWMALNGKNTDTVWGNTQGFPSAKLNSYFSQYGPVLSLSHPSYQALLEKQLVRLAGTGKISYFKHDFNHLSDTGAGNGHPATDRHGHEANVDAMIGLLDATRNANPMAYQNLTNWIWFSPWWLMHGDALWMLAGDDGANGNWPELSVREMATTDRDTYLWRMWGNADDRPLVPISRLMTHGIILNEQHQLEGPGDGVREWADHVMMYYGRGVQMKEWYITPKAATAEHWKALGTIHRWTERNFEALTNTVWFGGRPDEGHVYGYLGWDGNHAVLTTRNPSAETQILTIPFDATCGFRGEMGKPFHARVVFPYHEALAQQFRSGEPLKITVPGYATLAFEFDPGQATPGNLATARDPIPVKSEKSDATFTVPSAIAGRSEVLVIGYPVLPEVRINGETVPPLRTSKSRLNAYPAYAGAGMPSFKARNWAMASYDVKALSGKEVKVSLTGATADRETTAEAWLLVEQKGSDTSIPENEVPWAIDAGLRRETVRLIAETSISMPPAKRRSLSATGLSQLRAATLSLDLFGVNGKAAGEKTLWLNGHKLTELPSGEDDWTAASFNLDEKALHSLTAINTLEVRRSTGEDKFKFRKALLRVQLADGTWVISSQQSETQTTDVGWAFFEGSAFPAPEKSAAVELEFAPGP